MLSESDRKILDLLRVYADGITPLELSRSLWPDRRGQGLVIASGSMLARLERRGLAQVRTNESGTKVYSVTERPSAPAPARRRTPLPRVSEEKAPSATTGTYAGPPGWRPLG